MTTAFAQKLTAYFQRRRRALLQYGPRDYAALFGCVPEVRLGLLPWRGLLDCRPEDYGLTKLVALALYAAILSCIPGTTPWAAKMKDGEA